MGHWCCRECGNCLRKLSKAVLYFTNFVFFLIGLALIVGSLYVHFTEWSRFFTGHFILWSLLAGVGITIISLLGCCGVRTGKKRYLCPYTTFVFICLVLQVVAAALFFNYNGAMDKAKDEGFDEDKYTASTQKVMNYLRDEFIAVYSNAQCSPAANGTHCSDASWLTTFINDDCSDTAKGNTNTTKCVDKYTGTQTEANKVYCQCRLALKDQIEQYTGPLAKAAIAFAGFELILVIMSCCLLCHDRTEERRRKELEQAVGRNSDYSGANAYAATGSEAGFYLTPEERVRQQQAQNNGGAMGTNAPNLV